MRGSNVYHTGDSGDKETVPYRMPNVLDTKEAHAHEHTNASRMLCDVVSSPSIVVKAREPELAYCTANG